MHAHACRPAMPGHQAPRGVPGSCRGPSPRILISSHCRRRHSAGEPCGGPRRSQRAAQRRGGECGERRGQRGWGSWRGLASVGAPAVVRVSSGAAAVGAHGGGPKAMGIGESGGTAQASGVGVDGAAGPATVGVGPPESDDANMDGDLIETQSLADTMLEALLAAMPEQLAADARGARGLFIVSGCPPRQAQHNAAELYSPPRVARQLATPPMRQPCPNLTIGLTSDIIADEQGKSYNLLVMEDRQRCRDRLRMERPCLVVGRPPCTWWSSSMALNKPKMSAEGYDAGH